ncbi:MAG: Inosine-5'-monophosphate dehydrogenase [Alphaproteobacteria bacterium MarineAlpha9_Bin4]|nr:signal transduction protein [Pelagibacterales bacterium]PPR26765.1 MAG: Inosine-5'-monophosphate dehydrogenase [Alphaproteobacteria bacterium MarineAlpha9_Bin4]|tara:strand:- start:626 stop:1150 length:525 start_codon:yes stop_codon:yes gene_type:complete
MSRGYKLKDRPEYSSKPKPVTFKKNQKVSEAVEAMSEKNFGSVVIVDNQNKVIGICTERDILKKLVNKKLNPTKTTLDEIMTPNPRVGNENDDVLDWLRTMSNDRFRRLPVVDEKGIIKVIFTQGDFVSYTWPDLLYQASQMTKATLSKHFNLTSILVMIMLYSIAIIASIKLI